MIKRPYTSAIDSGLRSRPNFCFMIRVRVRIQVCPTETTPNPVGAIRIKTTTARKNVTGSKLLVSRAANEPVSS